MCLTTQEHILPPSYKHVLVISSYLVSAFRSSQVSIRYTMTTKGDTHHLYPSSFMGWAADLEFLQGGKKTSSTTSQTAFHATCRDWPQLHLTQQLFGQLQPVLLISKPCTVKLCMLVSSWLYHGHPRPLLCCHDPKHLLHLLWTSETKSGFKLP